MKNENKVTIKNRKIMIHKFSRYLLTLVALLAMTTGAWAQDVISVAGDWLSPQWDPTSNNMAYNDGVYSITFSNVSAGENYQIKFCVNNIWDVTYGTTSESAVELNQTLEASGGHNIKFTLTETSDVTISFKPGKTNTYMISTTGKLVGQDVPAGLEVTYDTQKTEASFPMPASDATVSYELVRDLEQQVTFGGLPTGDGAIVKKDGDKYTFATAPTITLTDNISGTAQAITDEGITLSVYTCEEVEGKWMADETATPVALTTFLASPQPGNWKIKATATTGLYDGTLYSDMFTLAEAYDLTLSPATNANLKSVEVDGTAKTADENGVIKGIEPGQKVKITTTGPDYIIRKAEVKKDGVAGPEVTETKDDADNVIAAEFDMPSFDATLEYDIVRNLASNMTVTVGDGTEGYRIRVKKDGNGYVPAELTIQEILALIKVHDDSEQKDLTIVTDFTAAIYAVDDNGQKTGDAITFANLTPGSYVVTATAPETSELYGGTTPQSNIFELYAQYDIAFTAGNDYALDGTTASITKQEGQNEAVDVTENIDENGLLEDVKPEATVTVTAADGYVISAFTATLPESTENFASINADKTAAQFAMPESNVNVDYTFLRNMAVNMDVTVGDGKDGYRLRIKKEGESFVPAEMTFEEMLALYAVTDNIESQNLVFFGQGKNCDISIFAVDDDDQPTGDAIDFTALTPGRYVAIASAAEGSFYYGETEQSNIFELYQGYEVEIAGGEYITYFKDEAIYVEDPEAALYTITAIGEGTATATQFDVIPANTPMLVKNNSSEKRTILLIPTENAPANFTYYDGFVGTLEATTILASDATADRYAFNGKQFVWVKKDLAVGANKAWLELSKDASNARIINIFFEETTGIDEMVNGQWSMVNGTWYDLNGRKLDTIPTKKGVYIFNGKKVVVK